MRARILAAAALLMFGAAAPAQEETPLRALVTANDGRGWEAVGRLDIGPTGFCTGALIEPHIVLTAAHCLFDPESRERIGLSDMEFLAGWRNGRAAAYRRVRSAVIHPAYSYNGPEGAENVAHDVALLELDQPIRNTSVKPFRVHQRPRKGDEVGVVSYARDRAARPSLQEVCHVLGRPAGTLVMSCDVDFGSSGAPVFVMAEGEPRIVSVVSAKAEVSGRPVALGTGLDNSLLEMRTELERHAAPVRSGGLPQVRRMTGATEEAGGGAKFLRP